MKRNRVQIAGAGFAGATLAYLLKQKGVEFKIYDLPKRLSCGLGTSCGFEVDSHNILQKDSEYSFETTCRRLDLRPFKYVLAHEPSTYINGVKSRASLLAIDKQLLINDLLRDVSVDREGAPNPDIPLVDATGSARAFSPRAPNDAVALTTQQRVELNKPTPPQFSYNGISYAWIIPLSADRKVAHLGAAAPGGDVRDLKASIKRVLADSGANVKKTQCSCSGRVRVTGPVRPMVNGCVVAIGEAAGLVSPLSGAGNIAAMQSAMLLAEHWDDWETYEEAAVKRFGFFSAEVKVLKRLARGNVYSPLNVLSTIRMFRYTGIYPTPIQFLRIMRAVRKRATNL